jgi:hypothetical protein
MEEEIEHDKMGAKLISPTELAADHLVKGSEVFKISKESAKGLIRKSTHMRASVS